MWTIAHSRPLFTLPRSHCASFSLDVPYIFVCRMYERAQRLCRRRRRRRYCRRCTSSMPKDPTEYHSGVYFHCSMLMQCKGKSKAQKQNVRQRWTWTFEQNSYVDSRIGFDACQRDVHGAQIERGRQKQRELDFKTGEQLTTAAETTKKIPKTMKKCHEKQCIVHK